MIRTAIAPSLSRIERHWSEFLLRLLVAAVVATAAAAPVVAHAADEAAAIEKRLGDATAYLASEELEGRGAGTKGIDLAADYIAQQFQQAGVKTDLFEGKPFQKFTTTTNRELGKDNKLVLVGPPAKQCAEPERIEASLGKDFTPLAMGGSATFDLPLAFAGYGITAESLGYDDYAGLDVKGKAVVLLRHEPQQNDPNSAFDGTKDSPHAALNRKVANAVEHGAAAVILCTDEVEVRKNLAATRKKWHEALDRLAAENEKFKKVDNPTPAELDGQRQRIEELLREVEQWNKRLQEEHDSVMPFSGGGRGEAKKDFPVLHCRRAVLDRTVKAALGTDLAKLEEQIDQGPKPQSRELSGWRATGQVDVRRTEAELKNVVAVLEGHGPPAAEAVVVGAHYDHLGWGGRGSRSASQKAIHPGADDNASGTAVLLEVARSLKAEHPQLGRGVVFVAFAGEEIGMRGSNYYVEHPVVPIEKTVAMLNLDMVGRAQEDKLMVVGTKTGKPFSELLDKANQEAGLNLNKLPGSVGASDHASFFGRGVPAMHFYTGMHKDYHRPSDTADKLNLAGMRRVARLAEEVVAALADAPERPEFAADAVPSRRPASSSTAQ